MKQNSELSSRPKQICQFIFFYKGEKAIQWRKNALSIHIAEEIGYP